MSCIHQYKQVLIKLFTVPSSLASATAATLMLCKPVACSLSMLVMSAPAAAATHGPGELFGHQEVATTKSHAPQACCKPSDG